VVPWGGGVSLRRDAAPRRYDLALDLTGLSRVVEYEPGDFTITAQCGATIGSLRDALGARRQELPLEAARAAQATLGGVLAANASGPRRLRFGAPRDRILGARFVLGDGTLARAGGKVVKNVAGYAIHRLLCGSRGGLAILVEASLKVAPMPARRLAMIYGESAESLARRERWAIFPRLEPAALSVVGRRAATALPERARTDAAFTAIVGLEDDARWVEEQQATIRSACGTPAREIEGDEVGALWQSLADLEEIGDARFSFTTADNSPAALAPFLGEPEADLIFHAPCGRLHLGLAAERASAWLARLEETGMALVRARGVELGELERRPPSALAAMRERIRAQLDPGGILAFGERWAAGRP
jgi:glycolate oxidase FAD binding subunit